MSIIKLTSDQLLTVDMVELYACKVGFDMLYSSIEDLAELKKYCEEFLSYPLIQALSTEE